MPYNIENQEYRTKRVTLATRTTTTEIKLTTSITATAVAVGGYATMEIESRVIHNSTLAPGLYLQESMDSGTTWGGTHTLDADMTTTTNYTNVSLTSFGETVRVFCGPNAMTTTGQCSYTVKAVLKR